jgi:hypothetical protein
MSASLSINTDELREVDRSIAETFGPVGLQQAREGMGAAARLELIDHFTDLEQDSVHHKTAQRLGAQSTGFYAEAARSVQMPEISGDDVTISINGPVGLAQRFFGGTIVPKKGNWLTIPAIAAAYGARARTFNNLRFVYFRPDLAALVERLAATVQRGRNGVYRAVQSSVGTVVYWLKPSVTQAADPTVLPTEDRLAGVAITAGQETFGRLWERQIGGAKA